MSSTTPRLSLYKPAGIENVNVTTDLTNNLDALDAAIGFPILTALPSNPFSGKSVAVSASGPVFRSYFHNGTTPASAGWVEVLNGSGTFDANINLASSRQLVIGSDVNLFRDSANVLRTNDSLIVDGALTVTGVGSVRTGRVTSDVLKSNTTLGNITGLAVAVEANAVYAIEAFIEYNAGTTPDIKFGWTFPASATIKWAGWGVPTSGSSRVGSIDTGVTTESVALPFTGDAGGNPSARLVGTLTTAGTAGTLQATFAQNTSDASSVTVKAGAWLKVTRLA